MGERIAGCTRGKDGWYRWFKGKTRYVAPLTSSADEIMRRWVDLERRINGTKLRPDDVIYRDALGAFLSECQTRVATGKPKRMAQRTLENYTKTLNQFGNFIGGGTLLAKIGPDDFTRYARGIRKHRAATYQTSQSLVAAFFKWCVEMEYLERFRPGPAFRRLSKQDVRDDRIARDKSYTAAEAAKLLGAATGTMHLMIALALACAMNNAEIANLDRQVVDLDEKVIDFRRRKTGKIRRICPIPDDVADKLRGYTRPPPASPEHAARYFLSENGTPYHTCSSTMSRLFRRVMESAGLKVGTGRNFTGLRTTWFNLSQCDGYDLERVIIMGHAMGTVGYDSYLESVDVERLRHLSNLVWSKIVAASRLSPDLAHPERASGS